MIYKVDHNSPPRYLIQGAEDDNEGEIDYKAMRALRTQALVTGILNNPNGYIFELEIRFRNIFKKGEVRLQVVKPTSFEVVDNKIHFLFQIAAENPVLFSYNYQAYYSKCSLFVTGPYTENKRALLYHSAQYIEAAQDKKYNVTSLDLSLKATLAVPTAEALKAIRPTASRKLFQDEEPLVKAYELAGELKLGAICQVNAVQITIPFS